ncbi:MAG: hypothetical protein ACKOD1_07220 [Sphingomonadales bacterium]
MAVASLQGQSLGRKMTASENASAPGITRDGALYRFLLRGQGYFKNAFEESLDLSDPLQQLVKSSIFKTQSGFADQKYYVMTNLAPVGSFVYLYADAQGRGVYAKVIGPLHEIRLNTDLDLRISTAAAQALGTQQSEPFSLTLYYWASSNR